MVFGAKRLGYAGGGGGGVKQLWLKIEGNVTIRLYL